MNRATIHVGDCVETMRAMPDASVDSIVTDPPYGLEFMRKGWDRAVPPVEVWRECLRVLKPGGHLLAFAGTRTQHRMATAIEDAGFEIRDMIAWVYGSGFPKSLDVSKAIDKGAGAQREETGRVLSVTGNRATASSAMVESGLGAVGVGPQEHRETIPATEDATKWSGWGTALKPALEPITVARKPLEGTVAENVLEHGTGAINVGGCRVGDAGGTKRDGKADAPNVAGWENMRGHKIESIDAGRWPANLIHDGSDEVLDALPDAPGQQGDLSGHSADRKSKNAFGDMKPATDFAARNDAGSAARFFYCAKPSQAERGHGNRHPTVKPVALMRYLVRLVTREGGTVLDPFAGSGTTGIACVAEALDFIGCELSAEYATTARDRIRSEAPLFAQVEVIS